MNECHPNSKKPKPPKLNGGGAAKESDVKEFEKNEFSLENNLTSTGLMDDMCDWIEEAPFDIVGNIKQSQGDPWYIWNHKFTSINVPHEDVVNHCLKFKTGAYFTRSIKIGSK